MSDQQNNSGLEAQNSGVLESPYLGLVLFGIAFFLITCVCLLQEYLYRRFSIVICPGYLGPRGAQHEYRQQMLEIERFEERRRQLGGIPSENNQDQLLKDKEYERMRKYRVFLKPYTMVVAKSHLVLDDSGPDSNVDVGIAKMMEHRLGPSSITRQTRDDFTLDDHFTRKEAHVERYHVNSGGLTVMSDDEIVPSKTACEVSRNNLEAGTDLEQASILAIGIHSCNSTSPTEDTTSNSDDDGCQSYLHNVWGRSANPVPLEQIPHLLAMNKHGYSRKVSPECIICLMDYDIGDEIVWSTRKSCPHAFHADCMLVWLSKGKKRCPICRNYFVPSQHVDDKDVITHDKNDADALMGLQSLEEVTGDPPQVDEDLEEMSTMAVSAVACTLELRSSVNQENC